VAAECGADPGSTTHSATAAGYRTLMTPEPLDDVLCACRTYIRRQKELLARADRTGQAGATLAAMQAALEQLTAAVQLTSHGSRVKPRGNEPGV
jgi:hypothetical protein